MEITKDMTILDIAKKYPETAYVFNEFGMHCFGCAVAKFENVEQGAVAHGIDVDELITALNNVIKKQ